MQKYRLNVANAVFLIALVVNVTFWPTWQRSVQADPPVYTEADVEAALTGMFSSLFNQTWDPNHWTYPVSERVTGPGRYSGVNQLGQAFTLRVVHWIPVNLASASLTPEATQLVSEKSMSFAGAVVVLVTPLAQAHAVGIVASKTDAASRIVSTFMPTGLADPNSALFESLNIMESQGVVDLNDGGRNDVPPLDGLPHPLDDCVNQAVDTYLNTVQGCNAVHGATTAGCNSVYNTTVGGCNTTFNNAINGALSVFENCMIAATAAGAACFILILAATGGWGFFFAGVGCLALVGRMEIDCAQAYQVGISGALTARTICVNTAGAVRQACINTADAIRDSCIGGATLAAEQQIQNCP